MPVYACVYARIQAIYLLLTLYTAIGGINVKNPSYNIFINNLLQLDITFYSCPWANYLKYLEIIIISTHT